MLVELMVVEVAELEKLQLFLQHFLAVLVQVE
jgi:hypothetical protein